MPRYEVVGFGRETGRKRVRIYETKDKEDAIITAASEGIIVDMDQIRILPEPPPTERQIEYAKAFGIEMPKNVTKVQLSELISEAEDEDWPTKNQLQKAHRLGIKIPKNITGDALDDLITEKEYEIEDQRESIKLNKEFKKIRTIEKTGKKWKFAKLIGVILLIAGIVNASKHNAEAAISLIVFGLLIIIISSLGTWWFHG